MSRKFKLSNQYYGEDFDLYKKKTITINEGLTVLVGCNGAGKTTFLHQIKERLKKDNIPVLSFDNLRQGGSTALSSAGFYGDIGFMATAASSSEGENIVLNMGRLASSLRSFIETGEVQDESKRLHKAFAEALWGEDKKEEEKEIPKERWLLLDAVDSGLSVDNIVDIKEQLFKTIFKDEVSKGLQIFIVIAANEYELARGESCFDVYNGKYIKFKDYEEYRNFILESRKIKNARWESEETSENNTDSESST